MIHTEKPKNQTININSINTNIVFEEINMTSKMIEITESDKKYVQNKYNTNRAIYSHLHILMGYSLRAIAKAFGVNQRTVWERINDRIYNASEIISK